MWSFLVIVTEITLGILNQTYSKYTSMCGNKEDLDSRHTLGIMEMEWVVQSEVVETCSWVRNWKVIRSPAWHLWPGYVVALYQQRVINSWLSTTRILLTFNSVYFPPFYSQFLLPNGLCTHGSLPAFLFYICCFLSTSLSLSLSFFSLSLTHFLLCWSTHIFVWIFIWLTNISFQFPFDISLNGS